MAAQPLYIGLLSILYSFSVTLCVNLCFFNIVNLLILCVVVMAYSVVSNVCLLLFVLIICVP